MPRLLRTIGKVRLFVLTVSLVTAFVGFSIFAAAQVPTATASLRGVVWDTDDHAVAGVAVFLKAGDSTEARTTTDAGGHYLFAEVPSGTYSLHAEKAGLGQAVVPALALTAKEAKNVDLKLDRSKESSPGHSAAAPEFFDEPHFTVAGVSDTTNLGGHGSDVVVRTAASLARDTASLGRQSTITAGNSATEVSLREDLQRDPSNFGANYQLGKLLTDQGRPSDAIPYLEQANRLDPSNYDSAYELASARASAGNYSQAEAAVQTLLAHEDKPELHRLLADVEEKQGHPVEAVREYQKSAEMSPTEANLFDWGSELLLHAAPEPALEVFSKGHRQYPTSSRMLVGLGVALYARGSYDQAVDRLCEASDLKPDDSTPYLFLGKIQTAEATSSATAASTRLQRFLRLQPENALANYYYAASLWNHRDDKNPDLIPTVESLLKKAVQLDPKLGNAYLLLGNVYSEKHDLLNAITAYKNAAEASPALAQAHYRLAQAYRQSGEMLKAQEELKVYELVSKQNAEQAVRARREMQEFVYTLRDSSGARPQ